MTTTGSRTQQRAGSLEGWFIETCDCETLCPCWVDDDPDDNHCTGLFAWVVEYGALVRAPDEDQGAVDVSGSRVVSVSTHNGRRRAPDGGRYSVLFVDVDGVAGRPDEAYEALATAFSAPHGPLADLSEVTGAVLSVSPAVIDIESGQSDHGAWSVRVRERRAAEGAEQHAGSGTSDTPALEADGTDLVFDRPDDGRAAATAHALTLDHTALHRELAAVGAVTAMTATRFRLNLPALPGGYVDATRRSAMRGRFSYPDHADRGAR